MKKCAVPANMEIVPLGDGGTEPNTSDPVGLVVLRTDVLVLLMQVSDLQFISHSGHINLSFVLVCAYRNHDLGCEKITLLMDSDMLKYLI